MRRGAAAEELPPRKAGIVQDLVFDKGFGWILDASGTEWWFHASAVRDQDFDDLIVGERVTFVPMDGKKGRKAGDVARED